VPHYTTKATGVNSMESDRLTEGFGPIIRKIIIRSLTLLLWRLSGWHSWFCTSRFWT